ncbi:helix-turn-helix transcriptional regulator [Streptomyces camponoticapitis]|uniref:helix-turn-helix transcriptional regulator n=1 Tax=Streptomyces camponoticapitis TaxID=1616125 RepID=UPI001662AFFC|nr:helix-turn-helix transcriptional regulator [Streptomyces camponoticapitis]
MSSLRDNVRNHRRRLGMSQHQLATEAGVSLGAVRSIEQDGNPKVETIHLLARALGTRTSSLFATESPEPLHITASDGPKLSELRQALMPPVGLRFVILPPHSRHWMPDPAAVCSPALSCRPFAIDRTNPAGHCASRPVAPPSILASCAGAVCV